MLLGEALAERASKKKQLEQLEARAVSVARYQERERGELHRRLSGSVTCGPRRTGSPRPGGNWMSGSSRLAGRPNWPTSHSSPGRPGELQDRGSR